MAHLHHIQAPLRSDLFQAMCEATGEGWFGDKTTEALCAAVGDWLARDRRGPDSAVAGQPASAQGYLWKQLFLPDGTLLRAAILGVSYYAKVEGDDIVCNGRKLSPSRFVNGHGGIRNAWRIIWLRMPGKEWERADCCRARTITLHRIR